jgi:hypothetical protein
MKRENKYQKSYEKHKEERLEKAKSYYRNHREERLAYRHKYMKLHKDEESIKHKLYRQEHREELLIRSRNTYKVNSIDNRLRYEEYKSVHTCVLCGEENPVVLEFHHLKKRNGKKHKTISNMVTSHALWDRILEEINKCVVLCSNCHLIVHDQIEKCEDGCTPFFLEDMIKTKTEQVVKPTLSSSSSSSSVPVISP